jgi:hypothetical protein
MRIIFKKHLDRRTFLRGTGVALSLPLLDAMIPAATAQSKTAAAANTRLGFVYIPHGAVMKDFTPAAEGSNFELSTTLKPLEAHRDRVNVYSGLAHHQADSLGDGSADHARATSTFLNGVHPKRTEGEDVRAGTTVDQIAVRTIGQQTRYPSIEIATEDMTGLVGACDAGYSCAYMNTISWSSPTTPLPMEINPRVIFERMFGDGGSPEQRKARMEEDRSILDRIVSQVPVLQKDLNTRDKSRMNDYLDNIREIERRLQIAEKQGGFTMHIPDAPVGVPDAYPEHVALMYDLMALAWQGDVTRVFSFMMAREVSQRSHAFVGVPEPHHSVSHHQDNPANLAKLVKIQTYYVSALAKFLDKLKATPDGDGTLLDHSLVLFGSCLSNSNTHNHIPLPVLTAGSANGKFKTGQHLRYPEATPMANLLVNVMQAVDLKENSIGDSTGPLTGVMA